MINVKVANMNKVYGVKFKLHFCSTYFHLNLFASKSFSSSIITRLWIFAPKNFTPNVWLQNLCYLSLATIGGVTILLYIFAPKSLTRNILLQNLCYLSLSTIISGRGRGCQGNAVGGGSIHSTITNSDDDRDERSDHHD